MNQRFRLQSEDDKMCCPVCGHLNTHVDSVGIHAREEDRPGEHITVDAVTGYVGRAKRIPKGPIGGVGRRHRIALIGTCEGGCEFALVFTQHKGETYFEIVSMEWVAL